MRRVIYLAPELRGTATAQPGEINHDVVDRYTLGHVAAGLLFGLGRVPWWAALALAVGWELVERPLKDQYPHAFPYSSQDTVANAVGDIVAVMAGWGVIKLLPPVSVRRQRRN
jgi:hypothetical protein